MKTTAILVALLATLISSQGEDVASPTQPARRRVVTVSDPRQDSTDAPKLDSNITVKVQGGMGSSKPLDVTLSGVGPKFQAVLAEPPGTIQVSVEEKDGGFSVSYGISVQLIVQNNANNSSYRDSSVTGNFIAKVGEPFPILKVGDQSLTIEIERAKSKKE